MKKLLLLLLLIGGSVYGQTSTSSNTIAHNNATYQLTPNGVESLREMIGNSEGALTGATLNGGYVTLSGGRTIPANTAFFSIYAIGSNRHTFTGSQNRPSSLVSIRPDNLFNDNNAERNATRIYVWYSYQGKTYIKRFK